MMRRRAALLAITVAVLGACGEADRATSPATSAASTSPSSSVTAAPSTVASVPSTAAPTSLGGRMPTTMDVGATTAPPVSAVTRCEDVPRLSAPAEWYRSEPIYVANEMPVDAVRAWAEVQPGYVEIWLDRDHFGWITVAFTADADARQAELETEFPGVGVVAVEVPTPLANLNALQEEVGARLASAGVPFVGTGIDVTRWRLGITVNAADEQLAPALAGLPATQICIENTGEPVPEGPQPTEGDGWRLLGDELVGHPYRTGIATNEEQFVQLWETAGMTGERPPADFDSEVVVWFGAVYGSSCPIRLDDVAVNMDAEQPIVHAVTVAPASTGGCTADANPRAFIVAIERSRLPVGPFAIQLGSEGPPSGVPEERTVVAADLSPPGAVATAEQIGPDPELLLAAGEQAPVFSGDYIEPGYPWRYAIRTRCGVGVLGQLNGVWWVTDEGADVIDFMPEAWAPLEEGEELVVDVLMTEGPDPTLTATAAGYSVTYRPVPFEDDLICS